MNRKNLANIRQNFAQAVFTHQVQEAASNRKTDRAIRYKIVNIVLVTTVLALLVVQTVIPSNLVFTYISAGLTVFEVVFQIIQLTFNVEHEAASHKSAALRYMSLRGKYTLLITDIVANSIKPDVIRSRRDALQEEYQIIAEMSPQTTSSDYDTAQSRLGLIGGSSEQYTWSDDEIDRFLPSDLKLSDN